MQRGIVSVVVVLVLMFVARSLGGPATFAGSPDTARITDAQRAAGPSFHAEVTAADRAWILAAIAKARPEAQRLIAELDGVTTFRTLRGPGHWIGLTRSQMRGGDSVSFVIDLDVTLLNGRRFVDRDSTVLHELGHAIDFALVPDETNAALEQGIPRTGDCVQRSQIGPVGACTEPAERFADTFAKWALRGGVSAVGAGYGVATPASLESWGAPLGQLARELPR